MPPFPFDVTLTIPTAAQSQRIIAALDHVFPADETEFPGETNEQRFQRWLRHQTVRMVHNYEAGQAVPPRDDTLVG